jgi:hypothetical protein
MSDKPAVKAPAVGAPVKLQYKLTKGFWDNRVLHQAGSYLYFEEGTAPKGSLLVVASEEPAEADEKSS